MAAGDRVLLRAAAVGDGGVSGTAETTGEGRAVNRSYHVIVDDREAPPVEVQRLSGDVHFGNLLRRRRRYLDELVATAVDADDVTVLRTDQEAEQLARRIEAARGDAVWLRMPTSIAPLDLGGLRLQIGKMRYALEPMMLAPVSEDDAPMVLFPAQAIAILRAESAKARRAHIYRFAEEAALVDHDVRFVDLRDAAALGQFLTSATEPRAFNMLSAEKDVFVKSSTDIEKMRREHDFFKLARPEMQRFLLPAFGFEEDGRTASYRMEYLRVPDAALQFVLGAFTETQFAQLLDQFFAFIAVRERKTVGRKTVEDAGRTQILEKLYHRMDRLVHSDAGRRIDAMLVAGGVAGGVTGLVRRAVPLIEAELACHPSDFLAFSHGDPCFTNILFDGRIGLFRLIDPRGASVREDAMMHPLYDLAKFSHSVLGGYDFVNNDLFGIEVSPTLSLELQLHRGGPPDWVQAAFRDRVAREGWNMRAIRSVEASLFLSMLPLHLDHERKLLGFCLIARRILDELEER
jgi:hypothetical protein